MHEYEKLIAEYAAAKAQVEFAHRRLNGISADLIEYMEQMGRKTLKTSQGGYLLQTTYVVNSQVRVDESGLRKRLGAKVFDKYTVRKLDRQKLEEALESGEVDRVSVSPFVTVKKSEPFLRFTMKEDSSEVPD